MIAYPDFIILLGSRAWLSFFGIVGIVVGTWRSERKWDERATQIDPESDYKSMQEEEEDDWDTTRGISWLTVLGWVLLALSHTLERHLLLGVDHSFLVPVTVLITLSIGAVQTFLMRKAVAERKLGEHKFFFISTLGLGIILEGILCGFIDPDAPWWPAPMGGVCIALAPLAIWKDRKMGMIWQHEAKANPNPILYNFGGPLLIFGWFWFFIGMNATLGAPDYMFLPLYFSTRTFLAYLGVVAVIAATFLSLNANDELAIEETLSHPDSAAFGFNGRFFGTLGETKIGFIAAFAILGISLLFPSFGDFVGIFLLALFIAMGFVVSFAVEKGLRARNMGKMVFWLRIASLMSIGIIIAAFFHGPASGCFAGFGIAAIGTGLVILFRDSKRGEQWMLTQSAKTNITVFSYGIPIFTLGLLLLAWSLSIPHEY